jgi:hypothetical protein
MVEDSDIEQLRAAGWDEGRDLRAILRHGRARGVASLSGEVGDDEGILKFEGISVRN